MDKYEYRVKTEQMLQYAEEKSYKKAMEIADTIDWRRIRNTAMLTTVSEIYENMDELKKARDIMFVAYEKAPTIRKTVYRIGLLSIKLGYLDEAVDCYEEFTRMAPKDPNQYLLKYKILRAQKSPLGQQIEALEEFKHAEYVEKWAYELAKLYHEAGMTAECLEECDDLILWFSEGKYVYQAMELKMRYRPLTPLQQEKYDKRNRGSEIAALKKKPIFKKPKERPEPDPRIAQKIRENVHVTGSIELPELPEPTREVEVPDLESLPDETPVRKRTKIENTSEIVTTISGDNLLDVLKAGVAVASGEVAEEDVPQVTGQMRIEEILANWEVTQRANAEIIEKNQVEIDKKKAARKAKEAKAVKETQPILPDDIRKLMEDIENGVEEEKVPVEEYDEYEEPEEDLTDVENMADVVSSLQILDDDEEYESDDEYEEEEEYESEDEYEDEEEYESEDEYEDEEEYESDDEYEDEEEYESDDEYEDEEEYESDDEYEDEEEYESEDESEDEEEYESDDEYEDEEEYESEDEYEDEEEYESDDEYEDEEEYESEDEEEYESDDESEYDFEDEFITADQVIELPEEDEYEIEEEIEDEEDEYEIEEEIEDEEDEYEIEEEAEDEEDEYEIEEEIEDEEDEYEIEEEIEDEEDEYEIEEEAETEEEAEEALELEIEEPEVSEPVSRPKKFDTGFIVQGRYDLSATSEIGLKAGLTEEQKKLFSYFVPIRGVSEQIVEILDNDKRCRNRYGTSRLGNIVVVGRQGTGKTVLAVDLVKAIQKQRNLKQGKVAIVTGESLNKKDIAGVIEKLTGGALIIEKAGKMNSRTVHELNDLMEGQTGELLFILEEQKKPLERLLAAHPDFKEKFTSRMELPIFINDELVTFGQTYAKENGYKIDEMGILALYSRIDMLQREDHAVTVSEVKEIMDEAIERSQKSGVKKFVKRVFGKNKDENDRVILKEEDFKI